MKQTKPIPDGVKMISIGFFTIGVLLILFGSLIISSTATDKEVCHSSFFGCGIDTLFENVGMILLSFGILNLVAGRKLWQGSGFWRVVVIILSFILFIIFFWIISPFMTSQFISSYNTYFFEYALAVTLIFAIGITLVISNYLFFNKSSIEFFSRSNK